MVIYVGPPLCGFSSTVPVEADCAATIDGMAACAGTQAQNRSATFPERCRNGGNVEIMVEIMVDNDNGDG
jgi:hypothetical protein